VSTIDNQKERERETLFFVCMSVLVFSFLSALTVKDSERKKERKRNTFSSVFIARQTDTMCQSLERERDFDLVGRTGGLVGERSS
jgi:hypothetical protein